MNTKQKSLRAIARELNISAMTLYRVLNNAPGVSNAMRKRVTVALDKAGVLQSRNRAPQTVIFDIMSEPYMQDLADSLLSKITDLNYRILFSNHKESRNAFLKMVASANTIVFFSSPSEEIMAAVKMENPDIFCINISGSSLGNVVIGMHDHLGGKIAAEYLMKHGRRKIAAATIPIEPTQLDRHKSFIGELSSLNSPNTVYELLYDYDNDIYWEGLGKQALHLIRENGVTAIFATCDYTAYCLAKYLWSKGLRIPDDVSILSYDLPRKKEDDRPVPLDTIGIDLEQLVRTAEYYLVHRPVHNIPFTSHCLIAPELKVNGSVKKINSNCKI